MKEAFNNVTNSIICSSIIACIVGLILILVPNMAIETIGIIAAVYIIAYGIMLVIVDIKASKYYIPFDGFLLGILFIILGIVLLCKPDIVPLVFTIALGIWIAVSSINLIKMALLTRKSYSSWFWLLLLGILDLLIGIVVIFNPFEASLSIAIFSGIVILVHGIVNIIDMILLKKDVKDVTKALEKQLKSA